ncbi:hypothetical protein [uncultured Arcticibacterium sp.]|uniref:hypothetical protein n=1 Tax=uncultured Arcticibacterium sp. TaxID=2173042 RepID=UPI0030FB2193
MINKLEVLPKMSIAEVETKFNILFPFLTIEFFRNGESIEGNFRWKTIKDYGRKKIQESFSIEPQMTVHEMEEMFWEKLGLQVSVFRKVGKSILETSFTSGWTLEHQNTKGSELQRAFASGH